MLRLGSAVRARFFNERSGSSGRAGRDGSLARRLSSAGSALAITAASVAVLPAAILTAAPASASPIPSKVSEFQPTLTATNSGAPAMGGKWGGRTVSIDVKPGDPMTAISASESGGVFKTTDGGANWTHMDGLVPFRMADLKYAPADASVVLATTFPSGDSQFAGGIWRSTDGGTSWSQPPQATSICGAANSFFTWGIAFQQSSNNVYVGTDCGLAVSKDLGATWSLTATPQRVTAVTAQVNGAVDLCDATEGHRRYTMSGGALTLTNGPNQIGGTGCNSGFAIHSLAYAPQEAGVLLATVSNTSSTTLCGGTVAQPSGTDTLYESDDAGVTWTALGQMCRSRSPWVVSHVSRDGTAADFDIFYSGGLNIYYFACKSGIGGNRCAGAPGQPTATNVTIPHADPSQIVFSPATNCAEFEISDGGVASPTSAAPPTCGDTFQMAAGSGGNGGYNALQLYEVAGQVHGGGHTDVYVGTQDNDVWASGDGGTTWPTAVCCEGFFFETPHRNADDINQVLTAVVCSGCNNEVFHAHYGGCAYNPCASAGWTNPPVPNTGPQNPPTAKTDNPFLVSPAYYLETGILDNSGNRGFYFGTVNPTTFAVTWAGPVQASGGGNFLMSQPISSRAYIAGPASDPTVYYTYCRSSCGPGLRPNTGLLKVTGLRTGAPSITTLDSTLTGIVSYCNGQGTFVCPAVIGVDKSNPLHLIVADGSGGGLQMKQSNNGGATWQVDTALTSLVLGGGRFSPSDVFTGSEPHVIAFDPENSNVVMVGTEAAGIIVSVDAGATWGKLAGSEKVTGASFFFFDEVNNNILVSSYGRGLWKATLPSADLSITKTDSPDPAIAGTQLYYTLTVTNNGPDGAPAVVVTDNLPAQVQYVTNDLPNPSVCSASGSPQTVTCALGPMGNGDSVTFRIKVMVKPDAIASTGPISITNTATVSNGGTIDPNTSNNTAVATTIVDDSADLKVTKICKPDTTIYAGTPINCTVYVDNAGPSYARGVVLDDTTQSNGTFTISAITPSQGTCGAPGPVTGGQKFSCSLGIVSNASTTTTGRATVTYTVSTTDGQNIDNLATVRADTPDPNTANNSAQVNLTVTSVADLSLTMNASASSVVAGTNLTYNLSTTNSGPSGATNTVISDTLPAGVSVVSVSAPGGTCKNGAPGDPLQPTNCNVGTVPASGTRTMQIVVKVLPRTTGTLHNDASVKSDIFDSNTANNLAHTDTAVTTDSDLALTIAATPNPVVAGTALSYQITIANNGPSTATGVTLTDALPASLTLTGTTAAGGTCGLQTNTNTVACQLPNLDPGQNEVVYLQTTVAAITADGATISNTASTAAASGDSIPANNTASVSTGVIRRSDLSIVLTSDADVYKPSTVIHYSIIVTNAGPSYADGVTVTQALPPSKTGSYVSNSFGCPAPSGTTFTCVLGTMAPGTTITFQLDFLIRGNKGTISSTATVSPMSPLDPNTANNTSTRVVTVK